MECEMRLEDETISNGHSPMILEPYFSCSLVDSNPLNRSQQDPGKSQQKKRKSLSFDSFRSIRITT